MSEIMKFKLNENVLRVALILFSIIFGILSVSLIALGAVYVDELRWPRRYVGLDFMELPTLVVALGSASLLMAFLGCYCSKTYNRRLLITFGVLLLVILCLELAIAIVAFANVERHEAQRAKIMGILLEDYKKEKLLFEGIENHVSYRTDSLETT